VGGAGTARAAQTANAPAALVARKSQLEAQVDSLRRRKDSMPAEEYERQLEKLLVDLARVSQSMREGGSPP
jgi:hypothetical protein